ncbi:hypothetical protein [Neolewinella agarilytica]|uniref:hypothetical protein n=1 Tax=Neolewinella agarilytica TaxID=478744 RepID=UPI0023564895|nr:hypothetical protein [Neolewinella agarilytica]
MITILTYIALTCGVILVTLLVLSIISGLELDFDVDLDFGDADADIDGGGGLGVIKGVLAFFSLGSWVVKLFLISQVDPVLAFVGGAAAGAVGVWVLSMILRFLLSQQENVNWATEDALMEEGTVYLKIPAEGEGLVHIPVRGRKRELKARSADNKEIPTGTPVIVEDLGPDGSIVVTPTE